MSPEQQRPLTLDERLTLLTRQAVAQGRVIDELHAKLTSMERRQLAMEGIIDRLLEQLRPSESVGDAFMAEHLGMGGA